MKRSEDILLWLYSRLLALYPVAYRQHFGEEMEEVFWQELRAGAGKQQALIVLRELRDLPVALFNAYHWQRRLILSTEAAEGGMRLFTDFERVAVRLRTWILVLIVVLIVAAAVQITWMVTSMASAGNRKVPIMRGSSAIILEDDDSYVRLPQSAFFCVPVDGKNQARCTSNIADGVLQFTLTINSPQRTGVYSTHCIGSYADRMVECWSLSMRARDITMPPVVVQKPDAVTGAEWQELVDNYAFVFPNVNWIFYWGFGLCAFFSLAVALVMWCASRAMRVQDGIRIHIFGWLLGSLVTALAAFLPLAWLLLMLSFRLENWLERF